MATITFDTLELVEKLKLAGMEQKSKPKPWCESW